VIGDIFNGQGKTAEALAAYSEGLAMYRELVARDDSNLILRRDLTLYLNNVGKMQRLKGDFGGAVAMHRESLDLARELAAQNPSNAAWQMDVAFTLDHLARAGDDPSSRWSEALAILARLKSQGRLTPEQIGWIGKIEEALVKLPPVSTSPPPAMAHIHGSYVGTNSRQANVGNFVVPVADDEASLTFTQSGARVAVTYRTSAGGQGRGSGIISGSTVPIVLQNETPNCPGSYTATFVFSGETVKWTYAGQDCGGPTRGQGLASKVMRP
jgi:hypothetical protein